VGPDIDQSLHSWHAAAATACGGWMRAVPRCQLMYEAEHTRGMFIFQFGTETHTFNGPFSGTTRVSQYQKGKNQSGFY